MKPKNHGFDLKLAYEGEQVRCVGTIDPGYPATGPTYDCGGEPGMPVHVDDVTFFAEDGAELEDPDGKILSALEDGILEAAGED